ncbi:MAG TPA: shikimate kinase [Methanothrix sp.]|nr:shikimate kinase [Methanothrix sp.]
MKSRGYARACGAVTVLNAVATWKGSAFGIDLATEAEVELNGSGIVKGDAPGVDTRLVERCVQMVLERFAGEEGSRAGRDGCGNIGAVVRTSSDIPVASGLKSSSTAANAAVLAALDALGGLEIAGEDAQSEAEKGPDRGMEKDDWILIQAAKIGVAAAKEVGVTITGALDDALASMLGGVVVTDNREMRLLKREDISCEVMLLIPDRKLFSRDTDVSRSRAIAPAAEAAFDLAMRGDYFRAMTINGLAYCAALRLSAEPIITALESGALGASLSGTGPAYAAVIDREKMEDLQAAWGPLGGRVIRTRANNRRAYTGRGI